MKKEYIILIVLIIGLSAYLYLKKDNQVHYELPTLPQVDTDRVNHMEIVKADRKVVLNKDEKGWTLTDKKYPADQAQVTQMLATLKALRLSALVSEAKDLSRYELDDANAVRVTAFADKDVLHSFFVGKTAPSHNHTFICLDEQNKMVYQANGNFKDQFDKTVQDFRDKKVLEFEADSIKKITVDKQGNTVTLVKVALPEEKTDPKQTDSTDQNTEEPADTKAAAGKVKFVWQNQDGTPVDKDSVSDLLSSLSKLACDSFVDEERATVLTKEMPACKILLENDRNFVLNLFDQKDAEKDVEAICSSIPYAFTLKGFKAEDINSYTDKLLGIEKQDSAESSTK